MQDEIKTCDGWAIPKNPHEDKIQKTKQSILRSKILYLTLLSILYLALKYYQSLQIK